MRSSFSRPPLIFAATGLLGRPLVAVVASLSVLVVTSLAFGAVVTMKSGMQFEGRIDKVGSLNENPLNAARRSGEVAVKPIVLIDDDLRRTFIPNRQVVAFSESPGGTQEKIRIKQRVASSGRRVNSVGPILRISPFDDYGRRTFSMQGSTNRIDVIQGITEITPSYTKVEALLVKNPYVWDMRLATSSIDRETLTKVLLRQIDEADADAQLRIVQLYIQAERYRDALTELERIIDEFPDINELEERASGLRQMFAQHLLREIELRHDAGQFERAHVLLNNFPTAGVAGETLLRVRDMLAENDRRFDQYERVLITLTENAAAIKDAETRDQIRPLVDEIKDELNGHTLERMADYLRLADDASMSADQKVALATSGWLLGPSSAIENLAVAISLHTTRNEVRNYLRAERAHEREESLARIQAEEGGVPSYVAKLLAQMKPPIESQVADAGVPGLYHFTIPGIESQPQFSYYLQLPPEYEPRRRYPCVVTLHGTGTDALQQVDWWSGVHSERAGMRTGQAARRGYIVVAPEWTKPLQRDYEYTSREHAAVLACLRDACHRTSLDTDRVFLSGHSMGGTAAWDIGLSHPDLWAGVIPIVARSDRYIHRYHENARGLPMYFVGGEKDGGWLHENGINFDRYLRRAHYDVTIVQYQGRGHEHFQDEIQRIFEWMELAAHRRDFFPQEIKEEVMRPWDNFFWWLELDGFPSETIVMPAQWPPSRGTRPSQVEGRILENNRITVQTGAKNVIVWLSPRMLSFDRRITVSINGRDEREEVKPDVAVMLEDARTRGDRQNVFWARVEGANRR